MADIGGDQAVTLGTKVASAGAAGALWGLFATAFLLIPALIGGILFPFAKKAQGALNNKVQQINSNAKEEPRQMSKQQREYQRKLDALNAEREEMELQARLEALSQKKRKAKGNSSRTSATI
jgi:F0F1-type ATP synthase membrane subunit b/b'